MCYNGFSFCPLDLNMATNKLIRGIDLSVLLSEAIHFSELIQNLSYQFKKKQHVFIKRYPETFNYFPSLCVNKVSQTVL